MAGAWCLCMKVEKRGGYAALRVHSEGHPCSARAVVMVVVVVPECSRGIDNEAVWSAEIPVMLGESEKPAAPAACRLAVWARGSEGERLMRPAGGGASAFSLRSNPWRW